MIPPYANPGFIAAMEDVLETYQKPRDPDRPLVCLDETSKQLIIETRAPIPTKPGRAVRRDYEYERNGVANIVNIPRQSRGLYDVSRSKRLKTPLAWLLASEAPAAASCNTGVFVTS